MAAPPPSLPHGYSPAHASAAVYSSCCAGGRPSFRGGHMWECHKEDAPETHDWTADGGLQWEEAKEGVARPLPFRKGFLWRASLVNHPMESDGKQKGCVVQQLKEEDSCDRSYCQERKDDADDSTRKEEEATHASKALQTKKAKVKMEVRGKRRTMGVPKKKNNNEPQADAKTILSTPHPRKD